MKKSASVAPAVTPAVNADTRLAISQIVEEILAQSSLSIDADEATAVVQANLPAITASVKGACAKEMGEAVKASVTFLRNDMLDEVRKLVGSVTVQQMPTLRKLVAVATATGSETPLERAIRMNCQPSQSITPVLVAGEAGAGKTYTARAHARDAGFDHTIEVAALPDMESRDLIGGVAPNTTGKGSPFVYREGPLGQAFRLASEGKSVCLIVDEIFRMPARQRAVFLTALTPDVVNCNRVYRLRTDQTDASGAPIIWEAPTNLLTVIATTNVGGEYDVEDDDPAGRERWLRVYVRCELTDVHRAVKWEAVQKGWTMNEVTGVASIMGKVWEVSRKLKLDGLLGHALSVRLLARAIRYMPDPLPSSCWTAIKDVGTTCMSQGLDGMPVVAQWESFKQALVATSVFNSTEVK